MNHIWKDTISRKFLLSYIAIIVFPIVLFSIFTANFCNQYAIDRLMQEQQSMIESSLTSIESMIRQYRNTVDSVKKNKLFFHKFSDNIPVVFIDIREELQNIESRFDFSASAVYYDAKNSQIHTSAGMYRSHLYYERLVSQYLSSPKSDTVVLDRHINLVIPLEYSYSSQPETLFILSIPYQNIENRLISSDLYPDTYTQLSLNGQLIYETGPRLRYTESQYYEVSASSAQTTSIQIRTLIPRQAVFDYLYPPVVQALLFILLILLFCGCIVYVVIKRNYIPLKEILSNLVREIAPNGNANTLFGIEQAVSSHIRQSRDLIRSNNLLRRDYALLQLLYGSHTSEITSDDFRQVLPGPEYLCILSTTPLHIDRELHTQVLTVDDKLFCTVCSGAESVLQKYGDSLLEHQAELENQQMTLGIGTVVPALNDIQESFLHSRIAFSEAAQKHLPVLRYIRSASSSDMKYPFGLMKMLSDICLSPDREKFVEASEMVKKCIRKAATRYFATCIFQDYLQTVAHALEKLSPDQFDIYGFCNEYYNKPLHSKEVLPDYVTSIMHEAIRYMEQWGAAQKPAVTVAAIQKYIGMHYLESNFSLKMMALDLGTSQSNLSHLFKKEISLTLSEYIDLLKMDCAKKMLVQPDTSINAISQRLGFANASTFIRKFKKLEGITPGEYREQFKETIIP